VACPKPSTDADVRQFRVRGGESCEQGRRVLTYAAFRHGGGCDRGCHHDGYTCLEHLGRLTQFPSGASLYTYVDDVCIRGRREAAWRIVFH
jgi:hypothetical protein